MPARLGRALPLVKARFARATSWSLLGQLSALVASMANFLLLARVLGPRDYGLVAAAWATVLIIGPVAALGADRLVVRDVSARGVAPRIALGAAVTTAATGATIAIVVLLLVRPVLLPEVPALLLASLALTDVLGTALSSCVSAACFATDRARAASLLFIGVNTTKLVAVLVFLGSGSSDPVRWAVVYAALATLSTAAQMGWAARAFGRPALTPYRPLHRARQGLPYSVGFAGSVVQKDADKPLLVRFGYTEEAGVYGVAYRLATIALLPVIAVQQVLFARFWATGGEDGIRGSMGLARRLMPALAGYAVLAGVGLVIVAPTIPFLVGDEYAPAVGLLVLLAAVPLLRVLQSVLGDALTGAGMEGTRTACVLLSAGVNLALNIALIPTYGVHGAIVATYGSEFVLVALVLAAVRRRRRGAADTV